MASYLSLDQLDVDTLKANLVAFMKLKPGYKDVDFTASNINNLIEVLSQNSFLDNFYTNMVGSEAFLDSATLRASAVSRAKDLNYLPRSRASTVAQVSINIDAPTTNVSTITIPANFYFTGTRGSVTYLFTLGQSIILHNTGGSFRSPVVPLYEGRIVNETFIVGQSPRYIISSPNIDISSLSVSVINSLTDTGAKAFTKADDLFGLDQNSPVFFVQGYLENQYEIVFGNGATGMQPSGGNVISVTYRDCSASDADGVTGFNPSAGIVDAFGNVFNNISVYTSTASTGGAEREDIDSIKFNAPRYFATQHRAVTDLDFQSLIKDEFPSIQAVIVFGGDELAIKKYGYSVIVTKPFNGLNTSDYVKTQIKTFLEDKIYLSKSILFQDPDYFFVDIKTTVEFDPSNTSLTEDDIETQVRNAIAAYSDTYLTSFGSDMRYSKLTTTIDSASTPIVSNDTSIRMIKRLNPILNFSYSASINFNNAFVTQPVTSPRLLGNSGALETSFFSYIHTDGLTYNVKMIDNGLGQLQIVSDALVVLNSNVGAVNYTTGSVNINNLTVAGYYGALNLYATLASKDMFIKNSQMLGVNQNDVNVVVKALDVNA